MNRRRESELNPFLERSAGQNPCGKHAELREVAPTVVLGTLGKTRRTWRVNSEAREFATWGCQGLGLDTAGSDHRAVQRDEEGLSGLLISTTGCRSQLSRTTDVGRHRMPGSNEQLGSAVTKPASNQYPTTEIPLPNRTNGRDMPGHFARLKTCCLPETALRFSDAAVELITIKAIF